MAVKRAETGQSSYLMAALRRAHGVVERTKMATHHYIHDFGHWWPNTGTSSGNIFYRPKERERRIIKHQQCPAKDIWEVVP
jgi:hypothetical protein